MKKLTVKEKDPVFDAISFLAYAVGKEHKVTGLGFIHQEWKNKAYATNGHTLHIVNEYTGLEMGSYRVVKQNKSIVILEELKHSVKMPNILNIVNSRDKQDDIVTLRIMTEIKECMECVNWHLSQHNCSPIKHAFMCNLHKEITLIRACGVFEPTIFESKDHIYQAYIMPLRAESTMPYVKVVN